MIEQFKSYIFQHQLFSQEHSLVAAVSGGADSVAMLHLLHHFGVNVVVAHCNFQLRGAEADADEAFVQQLSRSLDFPCFVQKFDTMAMAHEMKISVQMAARELRYEWFEKLRKEQNRDFIAVAHHADDQAETFFINLLRGSGIHGLKGMMPKNGFIVRPLLFARREEIEAYLVDNELNWRTDASNSDSKYLRNRIRHILMPALKQVDSRAEDGLLKSIGWLQHDLELISDQRRSKAIGEIEVKDGLLFISRNKLTQIKHSDLFMVLRQFGFKGAVIASLIKSLNEHPGASFYSKTHRISLGHDGLYVQPLIETESNQTTFITEDMQELKLPLPIHFSLLQREIIADLRQPASVALFDFDLLRFPLRLRKVANGDRFQPFGMNGTRLVSDFLTDLHLSKAQKERVFVLEDSAAKIIWLVGFRVSNQVAVQQYTTRVWKASLVSKDKSLI